MLQAPEANEHYMRVNGDKHSKRRVTLDEMVNVKSIGEYLQQEAEKYNISTVIYDTNLSEILRKIREGNIPKQNLQEGINK